MTLSSDTTTSASCSRCAGPVDASAESRISPIAIATNALATASAIKFARSAELYASPAAEIFRALETLAERVSRLDALPCADCTLGHGAIGKVRRLLQQIPGWKSAAQRPVLSFMIVAVSCALPLHVTSDLMMSLGSSLPRDELVEFVRELRDDDVSTALAMRDALTDGLPPPPAGRFDVDRVAGHMMTLLSKY